MSSVALEADDALTLTLGVPDVAVIETIWLSLRDASPATMLAAVSVTLKPPAILLRADMSAIAVDAATVTTPLVEVIVVRRPTLACRVAAPLARLAAVSETATE